MSEQFSGGKHNSGPIDRSRRLKRFVIGEDRVFDLLAWQPGRRLVRPFCTAIPEGARLLSVHYLWEQKAFGLTVEHESFEPVGDGELIPLSSYASWENREITAADLPSDDPQIVRVKR